MGPLACFVLAGASGALYRAGMLAGLPWGLELPNIRHAHSHLMYFGWVTPLLMALIAHQLPALTGRRPGRWLRRSIALTLVAALLAYPPFLLYGYRVADLWGRRIPLSTIAATVNIMAWYVFVGAYAATTRGLPRSEPLRWWDAALVMLVLSTAGAWGRAVLVALQVSNPLWSAALVALFLDLFSDGWFVLALLGIIVARYPAAAGARYSFGRRLLLLGLPVTFLLGLPVWQVPPPLRLVAGLGGVLVGVGLLVVIWALWPRLAGPGAAWRLPLGFLGLKALAVIGLALPAAAQWGSQLGLRVPYLHWLLLGFVSLGLLAAARESWGDVAPGARWMIAATLLVQLSLLPLTGLWPPALAGRWAAVLAAALAWGPVVAGIGMLAGIGLGRRSLGSGRAPGRQQDDAARSGA
jgi:hypothetical protein